MRALILTTAVSISDKGSLCFKILFQPVYTILLEILGKMIRYLGKARRESRNLKNTVALVWKQGEQVWQTSGAAFGPPGGLGFLSHISSQKSAALLNPHFCIQTLCLQMAPQQGPSGQMEKLAQWSTCPRTAISS